MEPIYKRDDIVKWYEDQNCADFISRNIGEFLYYNEDVIRATRALTEGSFIEAGEFISEQGNCIKFREVEIPEYNTLALDDFVDALHWKLDKSRSSPYLQFLLLSGGTEFYFSEIALDADRTQRDKLLIGEVFTRLAVQDFFGLFTVCTEFYKGIFSVPPSHKIYSFAGLDRFAVGRQYLTMICGAANHIRGQVKIPYISLPLRSERA